MSILTGLQTARRLAQPVIRLALIGVCLAFASSRSTATAQSDSAVPQLTEVVPSPDDRPREQFIPADQLETLFERDRKGVLISRDRFRELLQLADANLARQGGGQIVPMLVEHAEVSVSPADQQALVSMTLKVRKLANGWELLRIPVGNLLAESVQVDGVAATVARDPQNPQVLIFAHDKSGTLTLNLVLSSPLVSIGSDRSAAFQLPKVVSTELVAVCPAGQQLLVNEMKLDRPAANDLEATYKVPLGAAEQLRLRWTAQQKESESPTLVFVRTDAQLQVQKEAVRWASDSTVSVFGGTINSVIVHVPSRMEVTSVESTGLESWTLGDETERPGTTRLTLAYRQPFTNDRLIRIEGITVSKAGESTAIASPEFADVTSHVGRLAIAHEDGLRLMAEAGGGVRAAADQPNRSSAVAVFDFWLQSFDLRVAVKPRDRELFAHSVSQLNFSDVQVSFNTTMTIETLNAPLFDLVLSVPVDWQLTAVTSAGSPLDWRAAGDAGQIQVTPAAPVAPGGLFEFTVTLMKTIADPESEQKLPLPFLTPSATTLVGGTYLVTFPEDLNVAPTALNGLRPTGGTPTGLSFENLGTALSGELTITRKVPRLAARSILRTYADSRQLSVEAELTIDVVQGTTRILTVSLPESLGTDVHFAVLSVGAVPGFEAQHVTGPVAIVEQIPLDPANGMRPFRLTFDQRFAGSVALSAVIRQPRTEGTAIAAPRTMVQNAVRQHGVLVFEASPEQQLKAVEDITKIDGLFVADAGLADAPALGTGRRVALTYRFVQPEYALTVQETRFTTKPVPTAVVESIHNVVALNEAGGVRRSCTATFRSSGVQTLKFALPPSADGDNAPPSDAFLWSAILNNDPVEVRRDADHYLVALPANSDGQQHTLELLLESKADAIGALGQVEQRPLRFSVDVSDGVSAPLDVLQQTWQVRYPQTSLLVDSDGQFRPVGGVDQPGWFVSAFEFGLPDSRQLFNRSVPLVIFLLVLFVITALLVNRRWKALVSLVVFGGVCLLLMLPATQMAREAARRSGSADRQLMDIETSSNSALGSVSGRLGEISTSPNSMPAPGMMDGMTFGDGVVQHAVPADMAPMGMGMGGYPGGMAPPSPMGGVAGAPAESQTAAPAASDPFNAVRDALTPQRANTNLGVESGRPMAADGELLAQQVPATLAITFDDAAAMPEPQAAPKKGAARLSVRVNLEVPADYRAREFRSVGDSIASPGSLQLVVQRQSQIAAIRVIAALLIMILCWRLRTTSAMTKMLVAVVLLAATAGVVPLVSNQWQSVLDGILIGTFFGIGIWVVGFVICGVFIPLSQLCRRIVGFRTNAASTAAVLFVCLLANAAAAQETTTDSAATQAERPSVVVPYGPDEPALAASRVFIPHDQFLKLYRQAYPDALPTTPGGPVGSSAVAAYYKADKLTAVNGTTHVLSVTARYVLISDSDRTVAIALPIGPVGIRTAQLNGQDATLQPLSETGSQTAANPPENAIQTQAADQRRGRPQQQLQQSESAPGGSDSLNPAYSVLVGTRGHHVLDVEFDVPATVEDLLGRIEIPFRPVASGTLELTLPSAAETQLDVRINGRSNVYRRDGNVIILPIADSSDTRIQWQPSTRRRSDDVLFHSSVTSAVSLTDSGLRLKSLIDVECRQGDLSELDVIIPEEYSVQNVTGEDVAGWSIQNTDATRTLRLLFRRPVNDKTKVSVQFYSATTVGTPAGDAAGASPAVTSIGMPILAVRGSTRDPGTLVLLAGSQFQLRSDALSGVTQINPQEAPMPEGDALPGDRSLAWRYTRHPASVSVRASRTSEELAVTALHAVRLEEQRQLWTSRVSVRISGAPRSRIDLIVPKTFLALEVEATGLSDWYFDDGGNTVAAPADAGPNAAATGSTKILTVQLDSTREGTVEIVLRGQLDRETDRTLLTMQAPEVVDATAAISQMSVWLDAASENAGVEPGNWTIRPPATIDAQFRALNPQPPAVAFANNQVHPSAAVVRLRRAVPTMITESVTVTTATDTSLELTLALNWQVTRAASDTMTVELPSPLAAALRFDVPNQRRLLREDLGNGRTRVTIQLQQPVADRLFVLATGSLPLPADGAILAQSPTYTVADASDATIASQSHFWVLVNQSSGLLQPASDHKKNEVAPDQISIRIRPEQLEQSVTVQRLRSDTASWTLKFPEQHQVAPAVVSLADHVTVLAEDGSWRSRHQLQVRNESRQFLPVVIPVGSRLMYCHVQGRPTRVVSQTAVPAAATEPDSPVMAVGMRLLIPTPQSGAIAGGYPVEFAIAGHLGEQGAELRDNLASRRISIPVPVFPEFREDAEFGITVLRNRWSVYLPESWRASVVDDPKVTNVIAAEQDQLEDESLLSRIETAGALLQSLKSAKSSVSRMNLLNALEQQRESLSSSYGNDATTESERGQVLSRLSAAAADADLNTLSLGSDFQTIEPLQLQRQSGASGNSLGNLYLYEQELNQNGAVNFNNSNLIIDNRSRSFGIDSKDFKAGKEAAEGKADFYFRLPATPENAGRKESENRLEEADKRMESLGKSPASVPPLATRSRLLSRGGRAQNEELMESKEKSDGLQPEWAENQMQRRGLVSGLAETESLGRMAVGQQDSAGLGVAQAVELFGRSSVDEFSAARGEASGMLSLQFDIPTDGTRLDFIRIGGNPDLAFDVRSQKATSQGIGVAWAVGCLAVLLFLVQVRRSSTAMQFLKKLALVAAVAGCVGGFVLAGPMSSLCLILCVLASVGFSCLMLISSILKRSDPVNI